MTLYLTSLLQTMKPTLYVATFQVPSHDTRFQLAAAFAVLCIDLLGI